MLHGSFDFHRSQQELNQLYERYHNAKSETYRNSNHEQPGYANTKKMAAKDRLASNPGRNSPSSNIVYHYDYLADGRNIYGRPFSPGAVIKNGSRKTDSRKPEMRKPEYHKPVYSGERESSHLSGGKAVKGSKSGRDVYEFEKKVPMHSSSLEAQKFKTIIFLSGH